MYSTGDVGSKKKKKNRKSISIVYVSPARPVEDVGGLAHPLVGHPLGADQDRAAAVQHGHVGAAGPADVVPEDGRVALRADGHPEAREGSQAAARDLGRKFWVGLPVCMYSTVY